MFQTIEISEIVIIHIYLLIRIPCSKNISQKITIGNVFFFTKNVGSLVHLEAADLTGKCIGPNKDSICSRSINLSGRASLVAKRKSFDVIRCET